MQSADELPFSTVNFRKVVDFFQCVQLFTCEDGVLTSQLPIIYNQRLEVCMVFFQSIYLQNKFGFNSVVNSSVDKTEVTES